MSLGLIWLNTTLFIPVLKHLYKLCGGDDPAYWPGSGLWTDSEYAVFEAESILGGLFGASDDGGVAAAGEVGAAAEYEFGGIWGENVKLKHLNVMIDDSKGVVVTARGGSWDGNIAWSSDPKTGFVDLAERFIPLSNPSAARLFKTRSRSVTSATNNNDVGTITASYSLPPNVLNSIIPTSKSDTITVATVNKDTTLRYVKVPKKVPGPGKATLYRLPSTASTVLDQDNPSLDRYEYDKPMRVIGTHGSYYLVETEKSRASGLNLMFVEKSKVQELVTINDWLIGYTVPSGSGGRDVVIPSNHTTNWSTYGGRKGINHLKTHGLKPIENANGSVVDGNGRHWIAVGPRVLNENYPNEGRLRLNEDGLQYNVKVDVLIKNRSTGKLCYIYTIVGDFRAHTYNPDATWNGIIYSGRPYPNANNNDTADPDSTSVEFYRTAPGYDSQNPFNAQWEIVKMIVY